jgi:putative hemolysin
LTAKKNLLDLSKISDVEKRMIGEILEIKKKEVDKIMIPKNEIVGISYNKKLADVVIFYKRHHYSRYPVYFKNMDQIVGVIYIKDIVSLWNEYKDHPVVEFVRLPYFVYEERPALDVFLELQKLRLSLGIVIDEFGGVSGIITIEDLIEEIVGDIEDEFDKTKKPFVHKISDNEYILNTRMELDDFSEKFGIKIDENDVSTVSGLILKYADRIPEVGEEIKYKNFKFKVLEGTRRKISKVKLSKF